MVPMSVTLPLKTILSPLLAKVIAENGEWTISPSALLAEPSPTVGEAVSALRMGPSPCSCLGHVPVTGVAWM